MEPWIRSPEGGDNLYLSSIIALEPATGEYVWHYQVTPGDTWDFTATQHMVLADLAIDGEVRKVLMQAPKNGFFYVIDRTNGELISAEPYVQVNWATGIDDETGRPVEAPNARYNDGPCMIMPSPFGGHNWHPMAFSPATGLVYMPTQDIPFVHGDQEEFEFIDGQWNTGTDFSLIATPDDPVVADQLRQMTRGQLVGRYVFADYGSGRIWALQPDGQGGYTNDQLTDTNFGPTSFGVDQAGELYFTDINNSRLRMIVPAGPGTPDTIPTLLSNSGCIDAGDVTEAYSGLVPYAINAPFWSDGAAKDRHIGLPNGTTINRNADGDWDFPNGTILVKNFRLNGNLVETRHLMRHPDGVWAGYTYEWNSQQTEATRVRGGKTVSIAGQNWDFPSEGQCMECHTSAAGFPLGPETAQLNRDFTYPSTQRTANQLETLDFVLMFSSPLPGPASGLPVMADPADTGAVMTDRARAYLHTNCAQCHRPGGPTPSTMDLRYTTLLANTNACDAVPLEGDLGIANARLIAPGDSTRSVLVNRASRRDSHGMPPLGSNLLDTAGIGLLSSWINSLVGCN